MSADMDPSLLQDFLTESQELIDQLDGDLVRLESAPTDEQKDILNACFRALHTIKGAASFLGLAEVIEFAHAAEDALNTMRQGGVAVTAEIMDVLLQSTDVVRGQIESLTEGESAPAGPAELIATLHAIAEGNWSGNAAEPKTKAPTPATPAEVRQTQNQPEDQTQEQSDGHRDAPAEATIAPGRRTIEPGPGKADLMSFMVEDLRESAQQLADAITAWRSDTGREKAAEQLENLAEQLMRTSEFFELDELNILARILHDVSPQLGMVPGSMRGEAAIRLAALDHLLNLQAAALDDCEIISIQTDTLEARLVLLTRGEELDPTLVNAHGGNVEALLTLDAVLPDVEPAQAGTLGFEEAAGSPPLPIAQQPEAPAGAEVDPGPSSPSPQAQAPAAESDKAGEKNGHTPVEQTIRVEVGRLEDLLNLVGQLVLNKNRVLALSRNVRDHELPQELLDDFGAAASDLDQLMSELQVGVMRTRMQPLAKLFDRYPRVIRDMARMTGKKINLTIEGKDTEVDKSVLESLADPLVHILRNSADHGVEKPADRLEAGKPETGEIRLLAQHQGSHVRVAIIDDGKGLNREVIGAKALERGLVTPDQLATLSDRDVFRFIFEAGFSTAEKVSDLSGRGVGMDVVRTNIEKINGEIQISSATGKGTTIEIFIPLTVAIMPAMVVGVGRHLYSIPLQTIDEIVRPEDCGLHTVAGHAVMRLRNEVLPLLDLNQVLNEPGDAERRFAVVVCAGTQRVGLLADRLVGQQEIVIKPLEDGYTRGGPFSGATIREDGEVSLILDIVALTRNAQASASTPTGPLKRAA